MLTSEQRDSNIRSIEGVEVYNNDVVVIRTRRATEHQPGERCEIEEFSDRSRKRLAFVASNTSVQFQSMVTLTYPNEWDRNGIEVKRHLSLFLKRWRRRHEDSYLWFLEFQYRGAPHYHYLTTVESRQIDKRKVSRDWYEIVNSGDDRHLLAGTRVERLRKAGAWYALKYAGKMAQKRVPENYRNVGRFYGYSRDVKPLPIMAGEGNLAVIFRGHENYQELLEAGFRVIFRASGTVAANLITGGKHE